jgi:hypothetical protein
VRGIKAKEQLSITYAGYAGKKEFMLLLFRSVLIKALLPLALVQDSVPCTVD